MILGFKPQFKSKILSGIKIHTIREDSSGRWKPGRKIHFATGVRTANYNQFKEGECKSIQAIEIDPLTRSILIGLNGRMSLCTMEENKVIAKNDGFDTVQDFWKWFDKPFSGKIIHWTDSKYY